MRRLGIALLLGLLLVPALLHGHRHDALGSTAAPCAICVAAHHTPAVVVPTIGPTASMLAVDAPSSPSRVVPAPLHRSPHAGRGPPAPARVSVA